MTSGGDPRDNVLWSSEENFNPNSTEDPLIQVEQDQSVYVLSRQLQEENEKPIVQNQSQNNSQQFPYLKRSGTSGISGQHYETKLTMLFLLIGKSDINIEQFYLGTNVADIGVFDDIVFRYKLKGQHKPKVLFIQAKHRDNPHKDRVTVEDFLKITGEFSLHKLFKSYLEIRKKFDQESEDIVFKDDFENVDCHFVIYTPAKDNFGKEKLMKQLCASKDDIIHLSKEGKIFQFNCDNKFIDLLVGVVCEMRTKQLATCLAKFILSNNDNNSNMMSDKLIKTYHVFLSQNVLTVSYKSSDESFCEGKFLPSFFDNNDKNLLVLKETLCEEIVTRGTKLVLSPDEIINFLNEILVNPSADSISTMIGSVLKFDAENSRLKFIVRDVPQEIITFKNDLEKMEVTKSVVKEAIMIAGRHKMQSLSFKLPRSFGNLNFSVRGSQEKIKRRLNYLSSLFINLLKNVGDNNIVSITDDMVGSILQKGDIDINGGIGGLVGNLLILDEETNLLKFNTAEELLPKYAKQLFDTISFKHGNLSSYRFKIDLSKFPFPSFSLVNQERDADLIRDFLSKLRIYTSQKKEDEIENILKEKINTNFNADRKKNEFPFYIKNTSTFFLKVHDKIQKWWKQPQESFYLTHHCNFFEEAKRNVIDYFNAICVSKFEKDIIFNEDAVDRLELDKFLKSDFVQILNVNTDKIMLSCNKLNQYFMFTNYSYTFIDLDYVRKYHEYFMTELKEATFLNILIIVCDNVNELRERIEKILCEWNKKIIVVANKFADNLSIGKCSIKYDENNLTDLSIESQQQYLDKGIVKFQEREVSLGTVVVDRLKYLVGADTLCKLINNDKISIGKPLTNSRYEEIKHFYVSRKLYRHLMLKTTDLNDLEDFIFIKGNQMYESDLRRNNILLLSDLKSHFTDLCVKYKHHNIHWFQPVDSDFVWQESQGSLKQLFSITSKWEYSNTREIKSTLAKSYEEIDDKIVIISAEPGTGKSILTTRLSIETKRLNPSSWVIRINLRDYATEFGNWQKNKTKIDTLEAIHFLYKAVNFQAFEEIQEMTNLLELLTIENNEIVFRYTTNITEIAFLEIQVFTYFYNQGKVILLLDGVDEVLPCYRQEIIDLLEIIAVLKIKKIWITTRCYNIQEELERKLNIFSYSLEPFSPQDQKTFLKGFWKKRLELTNVEDTRFVIFVDALFRKISKLINDNGQHFTSLPLYLNIIAEKFLQTFKGFYDSKDSTLSGVWEQKLHKDLNLDALYELFVRDLFCKNRFKGKTTNLNTDEPDMKRTIEKEYQDFIESHKILGAYVLISENQEHEMLSLTETNKVKSLITQIKQAGEKTGIIDRITVYDKPQFVRQSFAEYFLALFLSDKLKSIAFTHSERHLFYQIFRNLYYRNVRAFFVSKLATDSKLACNFELLLMECIMDCCNDVALKSAVRILLYNTKGVSKDNRDEFLNWAKRIGDKKIIFKLSDC